jgi:hypothetical protein
MRTGEGLVSRSLQEGPEFALPSRNQLAGLATGQSTCGVRGAGCCADADKSLCLDSDSNVLCPEQPVQLSNF